MPDLTIHRWDNQTATDDMYPVDVRIEDTKTALREVMSQCKEWLSDPKIEKWCTTVRADVASAIAALEKPHTSINQQPKP